MKFEQTLLIESWTLYGAGVFIVGCRMAARRLKLGKWRNLEIEDYLMLFALINFTGVVISANEVARSGSNYLPADVAENLSPEQHQRAVHGSVMTFVLEIFDLTATWTVKACLLFLYARLTKGALLRQYIMVKVVAGLCALTYVLVMLLFLFYWCHPTREYFVVPPKIEQCATYYNHLIFATACNIGTDLLLFFIPIPIIIRTTLPMRRKIVLCFILGLGVFNILAAILNRYYNFNYENTYLFLYWYVAEVGISMFVGNMPLCYPLVRAVFGSSRKNQHETPPYIWTIGSEPRRRKPPTNLLSTRGTTWDKLDDREGGGSVAGADGPAAAAEGLGGVVGGTDGSDRGSQIELMLQGHRHGHHHETTVSSSWARGGSMEEGAEDRDRHKEAGQSKDIMVVRTVDVSSREGGGSS